MGKIIRFSDFHKLKKANSSIQPAEIQACMDRLSMQAGVLHEATLFAEEALHKLSMEPALFSLAQESANRYMALNFLEFCSGAEDISLDYEAAIGGREYTLEVNATCTEPNCTEFDWVLFRTGKEGSEVYDAGMKCWCRCPD